VYKQRARRIGHGLRLREHTRLMEYCVTEGICLELCPISNSFTNAFEIPPPSDASGEVPLGEGNRHFYPLADFLVAHVPVCLNTDNRFLHARHTVTDEYLRAAELTGGLSRMEVLAIVKSGFKHAFLPKEEQVEMLGAMDKVVFRLLKEEDEETNGPEGA
jgi:adenosine deaminase